MNESASNASASNGKDSSGITVKQEEAMYTRRNPGYRSYGKPTYGQSSNSKNISTQVDKEVTIIHILKGIHLEPILLTDLVKELAVRHVNQFFTGLRTALIKQNLKRQT